MSIDLVELVRLLARGEAEADAVILRHRPHHGRHHLVVHRGAAVDEDGPVVAAAGERRIDPPQGIEDGGTAAHAATSGIAAALALAYAAARARTTSRDV